MQGRQGGADGPHSAMEECLVSQEWIVLPQTGALVFPLTDAGMLVGLLVVDSAPWSAASAAGSSGGGPSGSGAGAPMGLPAQPMWSQGALQLGGLLPAPGALVAQSLASPCGAGSGAEDGGMGMGMGQMPDLEGTPWGGKVVCMCACAAWQ